MKSPFAKMAVVFLCGAAFFGGARALEGPAAVKEHGNADSVQRANELEIADYTKQLDQNPPDDKRASIFFERGRVYMKMEQWDKAIEDFDSVISIRPNDGFAHTLRGNSFLSKGDTNEAMDEYDIVIRLEPKNYKMHGNRAIIYAGRGDYDKAIEEYDTVLQMAPGIATYYADRAGVYEQMGKNHEAFDDYNEAIRIDPHNAEALTNRGDLFNQTGDTVRALADFAQAIVVDPGYFWAYLRRGDMHKDNGEFAAALEDFQKAVQLDPKSAYAWNQLAWVLATSPDDKVRDGKRALESAKRAVAMGGDPGYEDTLAAAYAESGDFENAVKTEQHYLDAHNVRGEFGKWAHERLGLYQLGKPFREPRKDK